MRDTSDRLHPRSRRAALPGSPRHDGRSLERNLDLAPVTQGHAPCRCGSTAPSTPARAPAAPAFTGLPSTGASIPPTFEYRTHHVERYGEDRLPVGNRIQDWPVTYDEMEKYYDAVDYDIGVSGKAGNLNGEQIEGGNVFEGPRSREYPLKPLTTSIVADKFTAATKRISATTPSRNQRQSCPRRTRTWPETRAAPASTAGSAPASGARWRPRRAPLVTHMPAALATGKYEIRPNSYVYKINVDSDGKATGVSYIDASGRSQTQEADIVIVSGVYADQRAPAAAARPRTPMPTASATTAVWSARTTPTSWAAVDRADSSKASA